MAVYLTEVVTDLAMPPQQRPIPHQFAMGDNNAYTITALLCDSRNPEAELMDGIVGGELVRPDGVTVALEGEKGDAVRQVNLAAGGLCNATPCSVTLPQACFAVPGRVTLTIKLTDGTTITQALSVSAVVVRTSTDEAVDPGNVIPDIAAIQAAAADATAAAADARAAASSAVRYDTAQSLTDAQQAQARGNILAAGNDDMDLLIGHHDLLPGTTWTTGAYISEGGAVTSDTNFKYSSLIPVTSGKTYALRWNKNTYTAYVRIHGYNSEGTWVKQLTVDRQTEDGDHTTTFLADGVTQIRISWSKYYNALWMAEDIKPVDARIVTAYKVLPLGLHSEPRSEGVLNVIRRARQMTDIKWSPAADIWRGFFEEGDSYVTSHGGDYFGKFTHGVEYTGIPYTNDRNLGTEWPIAAFASSVGIANSLEIAQSSGAAQPSATNKASLYGVVCVTLCSYAIGVPAVNSTTWNAIPGLTSIGAVSSLDVNKYELCDLLWYSSHVAIITDIIRDASGNVTMIEISEATRQGNANHDDTTGQTGGICRRVFMQADEFKTWFAGFTAYRYAYLDEVWYEPCPYVPMEDEGRRIASTNLPCVPADGNFASYSYQSDRQVTVLINSTGYESLLVKKDGVQFGKYSIGNNTSITVACDQEEAIYTAQLITESGGEITSATASCTWAIRPYCIPTTSVSSNTVSCTLTMKTGNWRPWYVVFGTSASNATTNRKNGVFTILHDSDLTETVNNNGTTTWTWTSTRSGSTQKYIGVGIVSRKFGGNYGYTNQL